MLTSPSTDGNIAGVGGVGAIVWGVEGFDHRNRSGECSGLGHEELFGYHGVLFRIRIEHVFCTVRLDIPIALRGKRIPSVDT